MTRIVEAKPVLVCQWTNFIDVRNMTPAELRQLDGYIAYRYYGWRMTKVPRDYDGQNECEVLTPDGILADGSVPNKGKVGPYFLVPEYTRSLSLAAEFARKMGYHDLQFEAKDLVLMTDLPELICRSVVAAIGSEPKENDHRQRDEH